MPIPDWSKYLVQGISTPSSGQPPARQDLRDLSPEQRYLYIEGLKKFQHADWTDPLSFYQIASIHGLPYETWPIVDCDDIPARKLTSDDFGGFCTHSSVLFLTWHRPYLSLYEASLQKHVLDIANGIDDSNPDKQQYVKLANDFRIPYWDWARVDTQIVPQEALDANYRVPGPPSSASINVDYNPLYRYTFPDDAPSEVKMLDDNNDPYKYTVRYPDPKNKDDNILEQMGAFYAKPDSKNGAIPPLIPERNLTERTAYLLQSYSTFVAMSNNQFRTGPDGSKVSDAANWGSVEDIHNTIHNLVGGLGGNGGHMANVPNSSFEPIFWLHHTNIDRLFGIWQALHEDDTDDTYVLPRDAGWGDLTVPSGGTENIETELYPFRPDVGSWYKSKDVKRTELFGYSYPETAGLSWPTTPDQKQALIKLIGETYDPPTRMIRESIKRVKTAGANLLPQSHILKSIESSQVPATAATVQDLASQLPSEANLLQTSLEPEQPVLRDLAPDNKYLEWLTNIKAEKHTLGGAYTVHVFLGPPDEQNVALWPASPNHVGTFAPLGQRTSTRCANCRDGQRDGLQVTGQVPLTIALMERYLAGVISDLSEATVVPYLTKNLHWRVAKNDGTVVTDRSEVDGLTVFVVSNEVTLQEHEYAPPLYAADVKIYPQITTNASGLGRGDGTGLTGDPAPISTA